MARPTLFKKLLVLVALAIFFPAVGHAASDFNGRPDDGGRPPGPPQEAIDACSGKTAGDTVEFNGPRGETMQGICRDMHGQLVAVPKDFDQRRGAPPEMK